MMDRRACIRISTRHQFVDKRRWHWTFSIFEHNGGTHSRILTTRLLFNTTTNFFNKIGFQIISSFSVLCEEKKHCCGTSSFSVLCVNMKISLPVMLHWRVENTQFAINGRKLVWAISENVSLKQVQFLRSHILDSMSWIFNVGTHIKFTLPINLFHKPRSVERCVHWTGQDEQLNRVNRWRESWARGSNLIWSLIWVFIWPWYDLNLILIWSWYDLNLILIWS